MPVQVVILGSGEPDLEHALRAWAARRPDRVAVRIGQDEALAHRIEAAADFFLMPSRYEPCGMNQMYSQRYGTIPIVRGVGGLLDTVVDATEASIRSGVAAGIHFAHTDAEGVLFGVRRALALHADPKRWSGMMRAGMTRDFSWTATARRYLALA
jgi:starch synthase